MTVYAVIAALCLLIGVLWFACGRKIARLQGEVRELRTYVAHLDEADRLANTAPAGPGATVAKLPRRRGHLTVVPVTLAGFAGGAARRLFSDPVVAGSAATVALAVAVIGLAVLQGRPPAPEAGPTPPVIPGPPLPSGGASGKPAPRSPSSSSDASGTTRDEESSSAEEPPPPAVEPLPATPRPRRPGSAAPPPTGPESETESHPEVADLDLDLLDELIRTRIDLGGAAPEPPTLLGKAREKARAVRHRVSEIATEPGQRQANTA